MSKALFPRRHKPDDSTSRSHRHEFPKSHPAVLYGEATAPVLYLSYFPLIQSHASPYSGAVARLSASQMVSHCRRSSSIFHVIDCVTTITTLSIISSQRGKKDDTAVILCKPEWSHIPKFMIAMWEGHESRTEIKSKKVEKMDEVQWEILRFKREEYNFGHSMKTNATTAQTK